MLQRKRWLAINILTSQRGWILLESLIGVVILSVAILALLLSFAQTTKGTAASTNRTQATYLAQQALDKLKAQDGNPSIDSSVSVIPPSNGIFTIAISTPSVSVISADANTDKLSNYLKPYQVQVSWVEQPSGVSNMVTMTGYGYVTPTP